MRIRLPHLPLLLVAAAVALVLSHAGEVRARAETALGRGMPAREAALARGFVLGEDDEVDAATVEDFRRSGLAHLLAVSGQNVALLALLAMPLLAALGLSLRARLLWILGLIAVYVPLAGAGPSIQRAGIMGGLSVLATLAGRRASRFYALAVAAIVLLLLEPGIVTDVGWQLSFAAVLGILLLAGPLRSAIAGRIGSRGWRAALADGTAMTIAATLATAPLIAHHFEGLSTLTLAANLLAMPAVATAMWLGMLVAAAGQVPGLPVEALGSLNALLLAYIAQVAAWCGRPSWAYLHVRLDLAGLFGSYLAIGACAIGLPSLVRARRMATVRRRTPRRSNSNPVRVVLVGTALLVALLLFRPAAGTSGSTAVPGLRVSVLDVGQGDAILLQPRSAPAVLVDGGPYGDGLAGKLREAGVERLGAAVITHDQSDHTGGILGLLGATPVDRVLFGLMRRPTLTQIHAEGIAARRLASSDEVRSGGLRLSVLWPPAELLADPPAGEDPNHLAIVLLARWRGFSMLLTSDAEAESTPLDPGPVDVLKIAHHGSGDAGLGALLERTRPRLALISVGEDNPFGHPTAGTLATLAGHGVRTLRTDEDGTVVLDVGHDSIRVREED